MTTKDIFRLFATPLSHFARKNRILLDLYAIPYEIVGIANNNIAMTKQPSDAGNNPLMKVPVLQHGSDWLIESDHIAGYIVRHADPKDRYEVNTTTIFDLNARAMLNGVMNEEVKVLVAGRHSVPVNNYTYFTKAREAVDHGLAWMEANHFNFDKATPKYRDFHLVCLWDHLQFYDFVPQMTHKYPRLNEIVTTISESKAILKSAPRLQ